MKQSCNKKEKKEKQKDTLTIRNFFWTLKNRDKMKTYKINIFKHETKKENTVK